MKALLWFLFEAVVLTVNLIIGIPVLLFLLLCRPPWFVRITLHCWREQHQLNMRRFRAHVERRALVNREVRRLEREIRQLERAIGRPRK